jgi:hypothetical protein
VLIPFISSTNPLLLESLKDQLEFLIFIISGDDSLLTKDFPNMLRKSHRDIMKGTPMLILSFEHNKSRKET